MRYFLIVLVAGIVEVVTIGKIHEAIDTKGLVILYVCSTLVGVLLAWLFYSDFKSKNGKWNFGKKMGKRLTKNNLSEKDKNDIRIATYCFIYVFACILIGIPGILSDLLGITLILPFVRNWISLRMSDKKFEEYYADS
ncbi:MAG: FxsA family protein [Gammaproteobacteria bacterium]|nr:FxsA family protein [Gammaproteobacteria bacterium]